MTAILETQGLIKRFAGLIATDNVSFALEEGQIHALIGPNGAGKSTLIHQLCGNLLPTEGRILFAGQDVTRLAPAARVALGLGRTFQVTSLLGEFTVRQNMAVAVQARLGRNLRILDRMSARRDVWDETDALLGGSPAIDHGNNTVPYAADQRGSPFQRVSGAAADIGAYEVQQEDIVFIEGFDGPPTCPSG